MRSSNVAIAVAFVVAGALVLGHASLCLCLPQKVKQIQPEARLVGDQIASEPFVIVESGVPTYVVPEEPPLLVGAGWVAPHASSAPCPGDWIYSGHGGEATGGPGGDRTWCLEAGYGDSCGTVSPWDVVCFTYQDVRTLPSQTGINYWHVDDYRTDQRAYTGNRALWCGSDSLRYPETPVECGTWVNAPGYGNEWNCMVQLSLPGSFDVATGCTLYFDTRYDMECKYDSFYVEYDSIGPAPTYVHTWMHLATFNATSNNPGGPCGPDLEPNPDYWGNTDLNRFVTCNWQERSGASPWKPAFGAVIADTMLGTLVNAPRFRWCFVSDATYSDADGLGDTDGAAWIDNIEVCGHRDPYNMQQSFYRQDFETCSVFGALPEYWTLEDPPGVCQGWHIYHDSDPPYEGGDGGYRTTVELDSSWSWRARPERGYPTGKSWRNGWHYRLMSPKIEIPAVGGSGCLVQYDQYMCASAYSCDHTDTRVRFHDSDLETWCPWINIDGYILSGGCTFWNIDYTEDISALYGAGSDSLQFAWELMDVSRPLDRCRGKHSGGFRTDNLIDNISIGFFPQNGTMFTARGIDLLHDSFLPGVAQGYNSFFDAYDSDTLAYYSGGSAPPLPRNQQLCLDCTDKDGLASVMLWGSIDGGAAWASDTMTLAVPHDPRDPDLGGEYFGTIRAYDFAPGDTAWETGTECWYYVMAVDASADSSYFPARADPSHPDHDGTSEDYLSFSILPTFPAGYTDPKILLVDGYGRDAYDWAPCLTVADEMVALEDLYEQTLSDAGYAFDKFDIEGAGGKVHIHPIWSYAYYDAVVWFTGPHFSKGLIDRQAQYALRDYLEAGGRVVLCGDRIAYNMAVVGEDSLSGDSGMEFLSGIMGCSYQEEMDGASYKPFIYVEAAPSVNVFGSPLAIPLDSLVVFRGDPYLRDMSYVATNTVLPPGHTAQMLLDVLNPGTTYPNSDAAIYTEDQGGQCVYLNFDLSAVVNHSASSCSGVTPDPAPDFEAGYYYGRVELIRTILEDLFGLASSASVPVPPDKQYQWALSPNSPNPLTTGTEINFEVASAATVSVRIYNALGQLVRVLKNEHLAPGRYAVTWDATNQTGRRVSGGVYFCKMDAGRYSATRKMLVVR